MEDGLVHTIFEKLLISGAIVLILIVVEDGLVQIMKISVKGGGNLVLILIVVEDGLVLDKTTGQPMTMES